MPCEERDIGQTLRQVRLDRKWSQASLAFRLGISQDWLKKIELGQETPTRQLTEKIKAWLADANARLS
jgi:transcriptional regulator with XRE-family HTH domain